MMKLKPMLVSIALAALAAPVLAAQWEAPYEQTMQDTQLPSVNDPALDNSASTGATLQADRPASVVSSTQESNPFANDWNFIAPPQ